jgi:hypothetical protein
MIRKNRRVLALAVVVTAVAAPAALANEPAALPHGVEYSPSAVSPSAEVDQPGALPHGVEYSPSAVSPSAGADQPGSPSAVRIVRVPSNTGFNWGAAGIGAGAALGFTMICVGGALVLSTRRSRGPRAITS